MVTNIINEKNRDKNAQFTGERTFVSFYVWVEIYLKSKAPIYSALLENYALLSYSKRKRTK